MEAIKLLDENISTQQAEPVKPGVPLVLQELRHATAQNHSGLERRLPFDSDALDLQLYQRLLQAYYGFYVPLEQQLARFDAGALATGRLKTPALHGDLLALGMSEGQIAALAQCQELPSITTQAQLMGVMYVIEGATLGGQILRRIAHDKLAIDERTGGAFLDVYGSTTGRMWKAYLIQLSHVIEPAERAQVVSAALATFTCFEGWLDRSEVLQ